MTSLMNLRQTAVFPTTRRNDRTFAATLATMAFSLWVLPLVMLLDQGSTAPQGDRDAATPAVSQAAASVAPVAPVAVEAPAAVTRLERVEITSQRARIAAAGDAGGVLGGASQL